MTVEEIKICLKQLLDSNFQMTKEQRYSLKASIEAFDVIKVLDPTIAKLIKLAKEKNKK